MHPIYQAEGMGEVFMQDQPDRLRWFPNPETMAHYGYGDTSPQTMPLSWFQGRTIGPSIQDFLSPTLAMTPAEQTPNYAAYMGGGAPSTIPKPDPVWPSPDNWPPGDNVSSTGVPSEPFPFESWTTIPMLEQYGIGKGYEEDWAKKYGIVGQPIYQIPELTYPYPETPIYPARHPSIGEGTFYEGLGTPNLPSYAGAEAEYPIYQPFESPLLSQLAGTVSQRMAGEGIGGTASEEYQLAMQQIDQAAALAQENLERQAAAGGWIGAEAGTGLLGAEQGKIEQAALGQKATAATQFAIKDAEMRERAIESAMTQGMQLGDYGAQQIQLAYTSRANAWGEATADRFKQYQADLRKAEDEYGMMASQHEMQEEGKKLAWEAARDEATKQYESYVNAGASRYEAEQAALAYATQQWQMLYASIAGATEREFNYARDIIGFEKELQPRETMSLWDWLAMAAVSAVPAMF